MIVTQLPHGGQFNSEFVPPSLYPFSSLQRSDAHWRLNRMHRCNCPPFLLPVGPLARVLACAAPSLDART